uniref:Zinc finger ring-type protein n=1 Tax=Oryza sativa subsp. japonica TaxID=39947 RepID=X5IDT0_ORYSJ|nr:zinc finger ring-type protein [Oryza sativa Japonica Group]
MGTGWRRALCTSVRRDPEQQEVKRRGEAPSPRCGGGSRLGGFFSAISSSHSSSNPATTTPTLRCRTKPKPQSSSSDHQQQLPSSAPAPKKRMPLLQALSVPSSPRSPSRFALLKASILPNKSRCGVCSHGVKTGAAAVFTAECSHSFHFPCIAAHAHALAAATALSCPVCAAPWRQAPFINKRTTTTDDHKRKSYDDDEPLLAPKAAAGAFNPIPEDDEDDATEFRGFFPARPRSGLAVTLAPDAALVSAGRRHGKYVVAVRVKAPALRSSPSTRAPIDLVTVLDVSQGMMGDKLHMLKRGMRLVIASLGPADRLAIVAFSGAAKRLLPLRQIVDRLVVCAAAQGQEQPQAVCVGDALRKATKVLEDRRDRNPVATVMLLSDTQQQQQQQQDAIRRPPAAPPATRFTHVEIPIGPGEEPARSALVAEEDDDQFSEHAFAKCLGGLVSVVMQEVQLELAFPTGEITAVYSCGHGQQAVALGGGGGGAAVSVSLGEMYAEEERELLVELRAPLSQSHPHSLSVRCSYREPASQETVRGAEQQLVVPALHGGSSSRRLHDLFVATRAVAESRRLAELNDYATAIHLLSSARAVVVQSAEQGLVGSLDTELSDMRWRRGQSAGRRRGGESEETPVGTPRARGGEPLTPTSAWRAAEQLAKVAIMRKSMNRVSDLHGFENARF